MEQRRQLQVDLHKGPKWLRALSYAAAFGLFIVLIMFRDEPWTKGTFPGLVIASCFSILVFQVIGKIALGIPVQSFLRRPPIGEPVSAAWLDRPLGVLLQLVLITGAGVALALFF